MRDILALQFRMLTFRMRPSDADALGWPHLAFGLAMTWLVGMGRWWDDPGAHPLQHLGLGSLAYVFVLAGIFWVALRPLRPRLAGYRELVTAVSLTAAPGLAYALPVERWTDLASAQRTNVTFLAVVAAWRVAAWLAFVMRARLVPWWAALAATLLPIGVIVTTLFALNLHRVVFNLMADIAGPGGPHDTAYGALFLLTYGAACASPFLLIAWIVAVVMRQRPQGPPGKP